MLRRGARHWRNATSWTGTCTTTACKLKIITNFVSSSSSFALAVKGVSFPFTCPLVIRFLLWGLQFFVTERAHTTQALVGGLVVSRSLGNSDSCETGLQQLLPSRIQAVQFLHHGCIDGVFSLAFRFIGCLFFDRSPPRVSRLALSVSARHLSARPQPNPRPSPALGDCCVAGGRQLRALL